MVDETELTQVQKINASKLLFSAFVTEIIGGSSIFLIVLIIGLVEPFLAAFLIIIVAALATFGCGLVMLWLGNPYNIYWKRAKGIYEDVGDGKLDDESMIDLGRGMKVKADGTVMSKEEIDLEDAKEESEALGTIIIEAAKDKMILNGEIAIAEAKEVIVEKVIPEEKVTPG